MPRPTIETSTDVVLSLSGPDRTGIVFAVVQFIHDNGGTIFESQQFGEGLKGTFFMRVEVQFLDGPVPLADLRARFSDLAETLELDWSLRDRQERTRVAILVSKFGHCLNDLLYRWSNGQLLIDVPVIVSNHEDMRALAEQYGVDYVHIPVTAETKPRAEQELEHVLRSYEVDLVVLARYMQVLSNGLCERLAGRAINIHHSFLPSFKGAKPYHQAFERGVKQVGATAHYVTADLDEGPIIEQEVVRVHHGYSSGDLVVAGRDAECTALSRAVQWHAEHRVLLNGHRTVVFR